MRRFVCLLAVLTYGEALAAPRIVLPPAATGSGYATVQDKGTPLTAQPALNFTGTGVTCTNDGANNRTNCAVTSGSGGGNAVQATVDFGAVTEGNVLARVTVAAAWVAAGSVIVCGLDLSTGTADHPANEEDPLVEMMVAAPAARVAGVSFDVIVHAPEQTWGTYVVNCTGV